MLQYDHFSCHQHIFHPVALILFALILFAFTDYLLQFRNTNNQYNHLKLKLVWRLSPSKFACILWYQTNFLFQKKKNKILETPCLPRYIKMISILLALIFLNFLWHFKKVKEKKIVKRMYTHNFLEHRPCKKR